MKEQSAFRSAFVNPRVWPVARVAFFQCSALFLQFLAFFSFGRK